ncbi:MAG: chemotaxis protein CheX [Opitutales bacterium]
MPATQEVSESLIRDNISRAISDVFKTMLGRKAELVQTTSPGTNDCWPPTPSEDGAAGTPQVVGTVGFLGDANGLIYLYLPLPFAVLVTCHLLGMTEAEIEEAGDEVINDAIGELTNMTVGSFKNGLCDAGFPCRLTIPSILRGSNFSVEPISSASRYIYHYDCGGHTIVTDILLKTDSAD